MQLRTHLLVLSFFLLPGSCVAAPYLEWVPTDPDSGYRYSEYETRIEDGGTYEVPINSSGPGDLFIDNPASIQDPFMRGRGEVFYIPDPATPEVREYVGTQSRIAWDREGTYEVDAYSFSISMKARNPVLAWLVPSTHASEEDFAGSIRFTITHGPPLAPPCCSSVAFIPGIQGSGLMEGDTSLWPPRIWGDDIPRLALTPEGESVNAITVNGILADFYGISIYGGFMAYMDELVSNEVGVAEWRALAYDWRFPPEQILAEGVETVDGTVDLISEIESLASNSNTGRVTIIAHSMGGLMGKALIQELTNRGQEGLVDGFIMVGSPQLGTPQGLAAMLHGHDQGIPGGYFLPGIIVNPGSAREIAQNMSSAHSLMPSAQYFSQVSDAPISFNTGAAFTQAWRTAWGNTINSYTEFKQFVTGTNVPRINPTSELNIPEVLNGTKVQDAEDFHSRYDTYEFPTSIRVMQIAGWGLPTVKGIEYKTEHGKQSYEPVFTIEGDGTVVYPSAVSSEGNKYFFNADLYRTPESRRIEHRDILDAQPVQTVVRYFLTGQNLGNGEYVSQTKPDIIDINDQLLISTHSPVLLGATDTQGRFTGIDPYQDKSKGFLMISQEIPGSYFSSIGSDQYLVLPKSGSYNVSFKGSGTGPTTIETAVISRDIVTTLATYTDMPVSTSTTGQFQILSNSPQTSTIELDVNGDGQPESIITPDSYAPTLEQLVAELKTKIQALTFKNKLAGVVLKTALTLKVKQLEKKIVRQKNVKATVAVVKISKAILTIGAKGKLIDGNVKEILELLNQIERQL